MDTRWNCSTDCEIRILNSDLIINHYNNFNKITDGGLLLGNTLVDLIKVENVFNIRI